MYDKLYIVFSKNLKFNILVVYVCIKIIYKNCVYGKKKINFIIFKFCYVYCLNKR